MGNRLPLLRTSTNDDVFCVELATCRVARRKRTPNGLLTLEIALMSKPLAK